MTNKTIEHGEGHLIYNVVTFIFCL